jgi:hypothetical protein
MPEKRETGKATEVLIENEFVAEGYRAIFKKLWKIGEDITKL